MQKYEPWGQRTKTQKKLEEERNLREKRKKERRKEQDSERDI